MTENLKQMQKKRDLLENSAAGTISFVEKFQHQENISSSRFQYATEVVSIDCCQIFNHLPYLLSDLIFQNGNAERVE